MQKHFVTVFVGLAVVAAGLMALHTKPVIADTQSSSAVFDSCWQVETSHRLSSVDICRRPPDPQRPQQRKRILPGISPCVH